MKYCSFYQAAFERCCKPAMNVVAETEGFLLPLEASEWPPGRRWAGWREPWVKSQLCFGFLGVLRGAFFPLTRDQATWGRTSCPTPGGGPASGLSDGRGSADRQRGLQAPSGDVERAGPVACGDGRVWEGWEPWEAQDSHPALGIRTVETQLLCKSGR